MPINKRYNLEEIRKTLENYFQKSNRKVFIEYVMLDKINDSDRDAENLIQFIKSIKKSYLLHVNLIAYNETQGDFHPSPRNRIVHFKNLLLRKGISVTIRKSLGGEIQGACGQLISP